MAKLKIGDHTVTVDDSFKSLSPGEQQKAVEEIASSLPSKVASTAKLDAPASNENAMQGVMRSVRGGIPFGDRIAAAAKTYEPHLFDDNGNVSPHVGNGLGYGENVDNEKAKANKFREDHPIVSTAGNLVGGLATIPFMPAKLTGALTGAATAPSMATRALGSALLGGGMGTVQGVSDSPDLTDASTTLNHAAMGGAGGAALGAAFPFAARGVGAAGSVIADALRGYDGISGPAGRSLTKAMRYFQPGELDATLNKLGPDAMLLDTSPGFMGKAKGVSLNSPEARNIIHTELDLRNRGTSDRLLGDLDANLGTAYSKEAAQTDMENFRSKQDRRNYSRAFAGDPHVAEVDVQSLIDRIDRKIPKAEGGELQVLNNLKKQLQVENSDYAEAVARPKMTAADFMPEGSEAGSDGARNFARGMGGVNDVGGDLASREVNKEMVGLLNKNGRNPDDMRKEMAQSGYFNDKYGTAEEAYSKATPNDVIEAIEGNKGLVENADNNWLRGLEDANGGRSGMWSQAREWADEANARNAADMPPQMIPKTQAENLHKIKGALDDLIEYPDRKSLGVRGSDVARSQGALSDMRGRLNQQIEQNVPGYLEANRASEAMAKRMDALKSGYERVLGNGTDGYWTDDLIKSRQAMSPGERAAQAMGVRAKIEEKMRRTANDLTAGKKVVGGENDFNRSNLAEVFGEEPTNNVVNSVEREKVFADSMQRGSRNSDTAYNNAAAKEEAPKNIGHIRGLIDALSEPLVSRFKEGLPMSSQYYPEIARIVTAKGDQRNAYKQALEKALMRRAGADKTAEKVGRALSLGAALGIDNAGRTMLLPVTDRPGGR